MKNMLETDGKKQILFKKIFDADSRIFKNLYFFVLCNQKSNLY